MHKEVGVGGYANDVIGLALRKTLDDRVVACTVDWNGGDNPTFQFFWTDAMGGD